MYKGQNFSRGEDLKEVWLGLCCWNSSILTLFKAKSIKIATLFKMLTGEIEYFFKIEGPINLYHIEQHIPSEPNMEVSPLERMCPSVNSQGNHFPYMEAKKQCIC